jgi:Winged helix DNA-binding domain
VAADRLSLRELTCATLDRQLLLRRAAMPAQQAVAHLAGLQAQAPLAPYVGLWTRLAGFRHQDLKDLMTERSVVRAHLMRNTVHLVTATDFLTFRPLFQPVMERALAGHFGVRLAGVDLAELRDLAAALLAETALTRTELGRRLSARWPGHDPGSLADDRQGQEPGRAGDPPVHPAACPGPGRHRRRGQPPARVRGASRGARRQVRRPGVRREWEGHHRSFGEIKATPGFGGTVRDLR